MPTMSSEAKQLWAVAGSPLVGKTVIKKDSVILTQAFCCPEANAICAINGAAAGNRMLGLAQTSKTNWGMTNIPKDIVPFAIDLAVEGDEKREDIKRHSLAESLDIFSRAVVLLKSEDDNQKEYVASHIHTFVEASTERTFKEVLPVIEKEFERQNIDFHIQAVKSISQALRNVYLKKGKSDAARYLIRLIYKNVNSKESRISSEWAQAMSEFLDFCKTPELEYSILPLVKGMSRELHTNKLKASAFMVCKLILRLPEDMFTPQLLPIIKTLCEEESPQVLSVMVCQLGEIIPKLNLNNKMELLGILRSASRSHSLNVRGSFITAFGSFMMNMGVNEEFKEFYAALIPLLKKSVKEAFEKQQTTFLVEFTKSIGPVSRILLESHALKGDDKLWFLDAFIHLSQYGIKEKKTKGKGSGENLPTGYVNLRANMEYNRRKSLMASLINSNPEGMGTAKENEVIQEFGWMCRANCARGFIEFFHFAKSLIDFRTGIHPIIIELMHDQHFQVKANMAANLYPAMAILEPELGVKLMGEVVFAFSDDNVTVIEAIVPYLSQILSMFKEGKLITPEGMTAVLIQIGGAILFCEERLNQANEWRIHSSLLAQLAVLPFCMPNDYVYSNFVPLIFHRLVYLRPLPSRMAASDALVSFLRHCRRASQRSEIQRRIKEGFAIGRHFSDRMLFLYMAKDIMEHFSNKYFRDNFFEITLSLIGDSVSNVRRKTIALLPNMKKTLKTGSIEDEMLLKKLESATQKMRNFETDRDAQEAIDEANDEMKKIVVSFKTYMRKGFKTKDDMDDEAKEMEERYIASLELLENTEPMTQKDMRKHVFNSSGRRNLNEDSRKEKEPPKPASFPGGALKEESNLDLKPIHGMVDENYPIKPNASVLGFKAKIGKMEKNEQNPSRTLTRTKDVNKEKVKSKNNRSK